jgi:hypothetical protein
MAKTNGNALPPMETKTKAEMLKELMLAMTPEELAEVKGTVKETFKLKGSSDRTVEGVRLRLELKAKFQDMAKEALGMTSGEEALASVYLAHWKKVVHRVINGKRNGETWTPGGKGNVKPVWFQQGVAGQDYATEYLEGQI